MKRRIQLYIAGRPVDLSDDSWILFNWTREDLTNPTAVVNSSSHQIQIPGTCRNNSLFGSVFRLDRRTLFGIRYDGPEFDPTRKTPFMLYDDAGNILESGYCRLDAVNTHSRKHAYTISLFGGLGSFFYALASTEDGAPRTLASLVWTGADGEDNPSFNIVPGAAAVADAWHYLETGESLAIYNAWNIINFAPAYNGLPDDFDASHALMSEDAYFNVPAGMDEDGQRGYEYIYKPGCDCALVSFSNPHNEWELADLRWYLQRPVVSVKAFFDAICKPENNGGFTVTLDSTFFNDDNPYYAAGWWTLPLIPSEARADAGALWTILESTKSPMEYLAGYCKHFGLTFLCDAAKHTVSIVTRATFYTTGENVLDMSGRIDRAQEIAQDPVLADKRWYQLGDGGAGLFVEQYKSDYGIGYGVQRIDTGYEFDAGTTVLTDGQAFNDAAEVSESNRLFSAAEILVSGRYWRRYFQLPRFEPVSVELWNDNGESKTFPLDCPQETTYYDNPDYPFTDWLPKLQLHGADDKALDGADVLVFFAGMKDTPTYSSGSWNVKKSYFITEDSAVMRDLAGGSCWDLTRTGVERFALPSFRRVVLSGKYIVQSFEWGVPRVRPVPGIEYPSGVPTTLYAQWWEAYLSDRYAADTRVLTCRVNLRGLPVGQSLLRRFYWIDNALWTMNAIRNHSMSTYDLTECEFVRVQDRDAYMIGPGAVRSHYLDIVPYALSYSFHPGGESLTLAIDSSSAWSLTSSSSPEWLTFSRTSGPVGASSLVIALASNTSGGRRVVTVTLTNEDGDVKTFTLTQAFKAEGGIGLDPAYIEIPASGTTPAGQASRGRTSRVTADGAWAVDTTTVPAWLTVSTSVVGITVRAGANAGAERSANIKVYLTGDTSTYATLAVVQLAGEGGTGDIHLLDGNGNNSATVEASGGTLALFVTLPDGDDWTITNNASFATVQPLSGSGNTQLSVTVPNYTGTSDRQGTIVATRAGYSEGAVFYLIQAAPGGVADYVELVRYPNNGFWNSDEIRASGVQGWAVSVQAVGSWSCATPNPWIHPSYTSSEPWSGSGYATIYFAADANTGAARTGTIVATCQSTGETSTFYVYQAGDGTLTLAASFNKSTIDASAQEIYLIIQATSGLSWTIDNVSSALSPARLSGSGPAEVKVDVTANNGSSYRDLSARVYVNSSLKQTATIRQNAPASTDYIRVTPFGTINMIAADTRQEFSVESSTSWRVQTSAQNVNISPSTGSGSGTVVVTFPANESTDPVTIPLTFTTTNGSGMTASATIVQSGAASQNISVTPSTVNLSAVGTAQSVTLAATGTWTASKSESWITLSQSSGSAGSGIIINISASQNTGADRGGRVTFTCGNKTATVWVNQSSNLELEVSATSVTLASANASNGNITVYASGSWTIASTLPSWLGASGPTSGDPNGETLVFTAKSQNSAAISRSATVRLELVNDSSVYKTVTVTQEGQVILYASPTTVNVFAYQGAGATQITCNTSWQVLSHSEDIVIEDGTESGTGDGEISWYAAGNPTSSARTLTIVVETTDHTRTATVYINQSAGLLMADKDAVTLAGNGDSVMVYVQSSDPWAVASNTVPSWLSITPAGGSQSFNELVFTAGENPYNFDRSQTITIQNSFGKKIYIAVTQRGRSSESLSISPSTVTLNSSGAASGSLSIVSGTSWYIEPSDEMMFSDNYGTGSKTITWTLGDNPMTGYREVEIVVRTEDGGIVKRCTIWQPGDSAAAITFLPETDSLTFYNSAASVTKTVKMRVIAKQAWTAIADEAWLNVSPNSGAAGAIVEVTIAPTISSSNVQIGHWTVTTSAGTRVLTITTLPI